MTDADSPSPVTTADLLQDRRDDDATALLFQDRAWTWREYVAECAIRAAVLTALRAEAPGEAPWHVGVLMDNEPEYLFLIGGAALAGATIVGVNPTRRGNELRTDITRTDTQVVLVDDAHLDLVDDIAGEVPVVRVAGDDYRALLDDAAATTAADWTDRSIQNHNLLLLFTSGSTGAPKAVRCSSARLAAIGVLNVHGITPDDVAYNAMPLFHGNAIMSAWAPIAAVGGTYALRSKFSASGFLPDIQRFKATFFNYVGRSLAYILAQPEKPEEKDNQLRFGWGTEASARDREEFTRRFGVPITESYGSSEGVCVIVRDETTPRGALGKPNPMLGMVILDPNGQEVPDARFDADGSLLNGSEAIGEIVARGGGARFEGYYNNPEADAAKIRDGDYWSGDLAYRDADGVFWFAGRTNDWIRVDSENFSTAPLERIVARYPGVTGVAAYAVPDPQTGDRVMISLEYDGPFDPADFLTFLGEQPDMGTKWTPHFVRITDGFPLTATRKLNKAPLRAAGWRTDDPVYARIDGTYRLLDDAAAAALADEFRTHDRAHLLPS
ncbi:AMP-binding protein [Gordonia phthalatica]|uniref:Acyl-CoA synthetase n=1 Tax=Gordonia phthalatica TaxID=1136941 RepID=A0A0N9NB34_9ACTN|nr:AMP-binding protein [Gordonia phthalatica]ALG85606.1 acyl-CoA synthetase [Gordonia phthalatica]